MDSMSRKAHSSLGECQNSLPMMLKKLSTTVADSAFEKKDEQKRISVTFVYQDGDEKHVKVPVGMSMLEAAHENNVKLEGAYEAFLACSTCQDVDYYNKLEDPTDKENDMLNLAFGLTETSRLGCHIIANLAIDGIQLAFPSTTRNFVVDRYKPKPH